MEAGEGNADFCAYCELDLEGVEQTSGECSCVDYDGEYGEVVVTIELLLCRVADPDIRASLLGVVTMVAGPRYAAYVDAWTGRDARQECVDA
jgi:hypothetical protein